MQVPLSFGTGIELRLIPLLLEPGQRPAALSPAPSVLFTSVKFPPYLRARPGVPHWVLGSGFIKGALQGWPI
jgi:hypothetical protein